MAPYHLGPFVAGTHTIWLAAHGFFMLAGLAGLAFTGGALAFALRADARLLGGLKAASAFSFLALVALTVTGLVPDIVFEKGSLFSGTFQNAFGHFQAAVTDDGMGAFTGPLLFDVMEHVSLVVPGLALLLCVLVWRDGPRVVESDGARRAVLVLAAVTMFWILAVGGTGVYLAKVLTVPYLR